MQAAFFVDALTTGSAGTQLKCKQNENKVRPILTSGSSYYLRQTEKNKVKSEALVRERRAGDPSSTHLEFDSTLV